jgi:hypothetical protein
LFYGTQKTAVFTEKVARSAAHGKKTGDQTLKSRHGPPAMQLCFKHHSRQHIPFPPVVKKISLAGQLYYTRYPAKCQHKNFKVNQIYEIA